MTLAPKVTPRPGRTKHKAGAKPTAQERRHMDRVAALGCAVSWCNNPADIHHEREYGQPRNHRKIVNLCWDHHQGKLGRHELGREGFEEMYGIDCPKLANDHWVESMRLAA